MMSLSYRILTFVAGSHMAMAADCLQRPATGSFEGLKQATDIVVARFDSASTVAKVVQSAQAPLLVRKDHLKVELQVRGRLRAGDQIEAVAAMPWSEEAALVQAPPGLRVVAFLAREGRSICYVYSNSAQPITTGLHRTVPMSTAEPDLADVITDLLLTPGEGYEESKFDIWTSAGLARAWNRHEKAFHSARRLLIASQDRTVRRDACLFINYFWDVLESCLLEFSDRDEPDPARMTSLRDLKQRIAQREARLNEVLGRFEERPQDFAALSRNDQRRWREDIQILAQYCEDPKVRKRAAALGERFGPAAR